MAKINSNLNALSKVISCMKKDNIELNYELLEQLGMKIENLKDCKLTMKDLNLSIKQMNMPILEPFKSAMENMLENMKKIRNEKKKETDKVMNENLKTLEQTLNELESDEENVDNPPTDLTKMSELLPELLNRKRCLNADSSDEENVSKKSKKSKSKKKVSFKKNVSLCEDVLEEIANESDASYKSLEAVEYLLNFKRKNVHFWNPYIKNSDGGIIPLCFCKKRCQKKVNAYNKEKELLCRGVGKKKCEMRFIQRSFYKFIKFTKMMNFKTFPIPKCSCTDIAEESKVIVKGSSEKANSLAFWYFCTGCRTVTYLSDVWNEIEKTKNFQKPEPDTEDDDDDDMEDESDDAGKN